MHSLLGKKKENISRFDEKLQFFSVEEGIDIILFPEMSFTGYNFKDYSDAFPMAVKQGEGE